MSDRLDPESVEQTLAGLSSGAAQRLELAGHLVSAARDADRWGLRFEAGEAMYQAQRCRVEAMMLEAMAGGLRLRMSIAHL